MGRDLLLSNIDKLKTTKLGYERIKKNLRLSDCDVVDYCKEKILDENALIISQGKNYYITLDDELFTVNRSSLTIITAHLDI